MKTPKYSSIKRNHRVNLSFTKDEFTKLLNLAKKEQIPPTTLCYIIIQKELQGHEALQNPNFTEV